MSNFSAELKSLPWWSHCSNLFVFFVYIIFVRPSVNKHNRLDCWLFLWWEHFEYDWLLTALNVCLFYMFSCSGLLLLVVSLLLWMYFARVCLFVLVWWSFCYLWSCVGQPEHRVYFTLLHGMCAQDHRLWSTGKYARMHKRISRIRYQHL